MVCLRVPLTRSHTLARPAEAISFPKKCDSQILDTRFTDPKSAALQSKVTDRQTILETSSVSCNRPDGESDLECFRRELNFPFLDKMLNELDKRFSDQACEMMLLWPTQ